MSILTAAREIADFLKDQKVPYAVIGGLAVQYWGESRLTNDVDIVVEVAPERITHFLNLATQHFEPRIADAVTFAEDSRVMLIKASDGTPVDISLGVPGYEEEVVARAVDVAIPEIGNIRVISAEDLVIHKCLAGRIRDAEDIEGILVRQQLGIDVEYVREWLNGFAPLVEDHDVLEIFERAYVVAQRKLEDR